MDICILTRSHFPKSSRLHNRISKSILNAGHAVELICKIPSGQNKLEDVIDGIKYIGIPIPRKPRLDIRGLIRLFVAALRSKARIVICFEMRTLLISIILKKFNRFDHIIYDCHEYRPEQYSEKLPRGVSELVRNIILKLERLLAEQADLIWAVNSHLAERFREVCDHIVVVPNYPPLDLFKEMLPVPVAFKSQIKGKMVIVYSGSLSDARGIKACLHVLAELNSTVNNIHIVLIGRLNENYQDELNRIIRDLDIEGQVTFTGSIDSQLVPAYLKLCDLGIFLVQPIRKRYDWGEPLKFFEYMAAGLPVVISDLPAKRRLINSIGNGILVDPLDYHGTAAAIHELIINEELMTQMRKKGYSAFKEKYHWESVAESMIDSLDALVHKRKND